MKKLFIILFSIQMLFAGDLPELKKGETIKDSVERSGKKYYRVTINTGNDVRVTLTNLSGDVNLYTKTEIQYSHPISRLPRIRENDCYSSNSNNEDEECRYYIEPVAFASYLEVYIMVYGIESGSYALKVTEEKSEEIPVLTNKKIEDSVEHKKTKQYQVSVKKGKEVTVTLSDLTADADLRVKFGRKANQHAFDCKSTNGGTKPDVCTFTPKKDGTLYVQVDGYKEASYSLKATTETDNGSKECIGLTELEKAIKSGADVSDVNTTCITDMSELFLFNESFNQDISSWDVSNVTNMEGMFRDATSFNQDISSWDVSKVTNMNYMFNNTSSFSNHDLSGWNVANVVTKVNFADDVGDGNKAPRFEETVNDELIKTAQEHCLNKNNSTDKVLCSSEKDIAYVLTSKLLSNSLYRVNFITKTTKKTHTFEKPTVNDEYYLVPLKNTDLVAVNISYDIGDLMDITNFYYQGEKLQLSFTFSEPVNTQKINGKYKTIENGKKLEITYEEADYQDPNNFWKNYREIYDISNPAEVKLISKTEVTCLGKEWLKTAIDEGKDVSTANVSCINDMSKLFIGNRTFNQDISSWDVSNVTNMDSMFKDATSFNQDISSWNVSKVTNMDYMFNNTSSFSNHDLSRWNAVNVVTKKNFADGVGDGNRAPRWK